MGVANSAHEFDGGFPESQKVAVIGIGCKFAGDTHGAEAFWKTVRAARDCTGRAPGDRFDLTHWHRAGPATKGRMYTDRGGFLAKDPFLFDPTFFRMTKEEADHLDPMVRLMLCETWNALENAGIPPQTLRGSNTGVFVGCTAAEYTQYTSLAMENISKYTNSGTNSCMAANRVSYEFDFRGPSFSVDTACSSSLYAAVLACQALRAGECDLAVVGGVNLVLLPSTTVGFCQAEMMAADGRCKSFNATADGYARGEGVGVVILQRLPGARRTGRRIYASLSGSRVCNDGRTMGIANPSQSAQEDMLRASLQAAGVAAGQVSYVEAHGTGTQAGDRAELSAIGHVIGQQQDTPLPVGSVKSNIAHTEGAAGVAGLIKTSLMMYHGEILPTHGYSTPRADLSLDQLGLRVPVTPEPWAEPERVAMVSSFGFGGANASLVLHSEPAGAAVSLPPCSGPQTLPLLCSGHSAEAARARLTHIHQLLAAGQVHLADLCATCALHLEQMACRVSLAVTSPTDALRQVSELLDQPDLALKPAPEAVFLVYVFNGMGSQWPYMGRDLIQGSDVFRKSIQEFDNELKTFGEKFSVQEILMKGYRDVNKTKYAQPCICALQLALLAELRSHGVTPGLVLGHSVGEVAAACAAGALTLRETVRLITTRGRHQHRLAGRGRMVAVLGEGQDADAGLLEEGKVSLACVNSPSQRVYSGNTDAVTTLAARLRGRGRKVVELNVNNAFHSHQVDALKTHFTLDCREILSGSPLSTVPLVSTVSGKLEPASVVSTADYWFTNMRAPVQFLEGVKTALKLADKPVVFVEIGAASVLRNAIRDIAASVDITNAQVVATLKKPKQHEHQQRDLLSTLLSLHSAGVTVDFQRTFPVEHSIVSLPPYPFAEVICRTVSRITDSVLLHPAEQHPLLGKHVLRENDRQLWLAQVSMHDIPWVRDHVLEGAVLFPGAGFIDVTLAALTSSREEHGHLYLRDVVFHRFMAISEHKTDVYLNVQHNPNEITCCIYTLENDKKISHCTSVFSNRPPSAARDLPHVSVHGHTFTQTELYETFRTAGFLLGASFQTLGSVVCSADCQGAVCDVTVPADITGELQKHVIHPAVLDAVFQAVAFLSVQYEQNVLGNGKPKQQVPYSVQEIQFNIAMLESCKTPEKFAVHLRMNKDDAEETSYDAGIRQGGSDTVVMSLRGIVFRSLRQAPVKGTAPLQWSLQWQRVGDLQVEHGRAEGVLVLADDLMTVPQNGLPPSSPMSRFKPSKASLAGINTLVVFLSPASNDVNAFDKEVTQRLMQLQSLLLSLAEMDVDLPIWLTTLHAHHVTPGDTPSPASLAVSSLGLTQYTELRGLDVTWLDVTRLEQAAAVLTGLPAGLPEDELAVREEDGGLVLYARRLVTAPHILQQKHRQVSAWTLSSEGAVLEDRYVTGGLSVIGYCTAGNTGYTALCEDEMGELYICPYLKTLSSAVPGHMCKEVGVHGILLLKLFKRTLKFALFRSTHLAPEHPVLLYCGTDDDDVEKRLKMQMLLIKGWIIQQAATDQAHSIIYDLTTSDAIPSPSTAKVRNVLCVTDDVRKVTTELCADHIFLQRDNFTSETYSNALDLLLEAFSAINLQPDELAACADSVRQNEWTQGELGTDCDFVSLPRSLQVPTAGHQVAFAASPGACYVVVGGTKGLGLQCALWLFDQGADTVAVLGRRPPDEQLRNVINTCADSGKTLLALQADASDADTLYEAFSALASNQHRIEGIFHPVVCYVDRYLNTMELQHWQQSLNAKSRSALVLHNITLQMGLPIKHFVMFSSATTVAGSDGQANYVAANVYLQGLAAWRRAQGLPACTVSFGTISDVGEAAERDVVQHWRDLGIGELDSRTALDVMGNIIAASEPAAGILGPDTDMLRYANFIFKMKNTAMGFRASRFKELYIEVKEENLFAQATAKMNAAETKDYIRERMLSVVAEKSGMSMQTVGEVQKLGQLGLDSMFCAELGVQLSEEFNVSVSPVDLLNDNLSVSDLVEKVYRKSQTGGASMAGQGGDAMQPRSVVRIAAGSRPGAAVLFPPMPGGQTILSRLIHQLTRHSGRAVFVVRVPGWEDRPNDRPTSDLQACVSDIAADLSVLIDQGELPADYVFYGHSSGALLAYETTHALRASGKPLPQTLIVAAWKAPAFLYPWPAMPSFDTSSTPSVDMVMADLRKLSIFDKRVGQNRAYMERYAASITANMRMVIWYRRPARAPLSVSLVVLAGKGDVFCTPDMQQRWTEEVKEQPTFATLPGGHLFLNHDEGARRIAGFIPEVQELSTML